MLDTIRFFMGLILIFQSGAVFAVWAVNIVEGKQSNAKYLLWWVVLSIAGLYFVTSKLGA